jgi:tetratricopeptide repeat protein 30
VQQFLDALLLRRTFPEEAITRLEQMGTALVDNLKRLTKEVQQARAIRDDDTIKRAITDYDEAIEQ